MISLGYDIGSSSVKCAAIDLETGATLAADFLPRDEMTIQAPQPGFAEQDPEHWWHYVQHVTHALMRTGRFRADEVASIGLSYQMHGLVIIGDDHKPLRPAIIWCDSRAVEIGERALRALGEELCLSTLLNAPGNFTASKLRWVREHQPDLYGRIEKALLPGDYIALCMTGEATTTVTGLSEGIFWDFRRGGLATHLLREFDIDERLLAPLVPAMGPQGYLTKAAADALGLREGIPVAYRAGDQPNNAFALNVLRPGEVAATAGTSGVVYGVTDRAVADPRSRVNLFAHVNHTSDTPRLGILLCVNGTGILFSWLRRMFGGNVSYQELNGLASQIPIGSDGLMLLPFGNGAERMLENRSPGGCMLGMDLVRHSRGHLVRAAQEGIAFAFQAGMEIMRSMGMPTALIRAGHANLFLSPVFRQTVATVSGARIELYDTDGAAGAARGAAVGIGAYETVDDAFASLKRVQEVEPAPGDVQRTLEAYGRWKDALARLLE